MGLWAVPSASLYALNPFDRQKSGRSSVIKELNEEECLAYWDRVCEVWADLDSDPYHFTVDGLLDTYPADPTG